MYRYDMSEYDLKVSVGDRVRNKSTGCVYTVSGVLPMPQTTLVVGTKPKGELQDLVLVGGDRSERLAAAVNSHLMSCYWEVVS